MKTKIFTLLLLSALSLTAVAQQQADVKRVAILETVDKMGTVGYLKLLQFRSNLTSAVTNTDGYEGSDRVVRGGSWYNCCRVTCRNHGSPSNRYGNLGFRVVCLP